MEIKNWRLTYCKMNKNCQWVTYLQERLLWLQDKLSMEQYTSNILFGFQDLVLQNSLAEILVISENHIFLLFLLKTVKI